MTTTRNDIQKDKETKNPQDEVIVIRRIANGTIDSQYYLRKSSQLRSAFFITMISNLLSNLKIRADNQ